MKKFLISWSVFYKKCGADYVKVQQKPAQNLPSDEEGKIRKYCSLDGDADRVVYYYLKPEENEKKFVLLDGDKISTLVKAQISH